eukprot:scaffold791_cov115-Cylindrotheca_fusiformis.AAC.7
MGVGWEDGSSIRVLFGTTAFSIPANPFGWSNICWRHIIERQGQREYEREHKAVARGLRLDGSCIEKEGRSEHETKLSKERAKRQNNFAWLEGEQAVMTQKVRMGDGLVKGGAMGLAKAKVATGKMGIEKGGKF